MDPVEITLRLQKYNENIHIKGEQRLPSGLPSSSLIPLWWEAIPIKLQDIEKM